MTTNQTPESPYTKIKSQISFAITGRQEIVCPNCGKSATATTSGKKKVNYRVTRQVKTTCRHCGVSYSFIWS